MNVERGLVILFVSDIQELHRFPNKSNNVCRLLCSHGLSLSYHDAVAVFLYSTICRIGLTTSSVTIGKIVPSPLPTPPFTGGFITSPDKNSR